MDARERAKELHPCRVGSVSCLGHVEPRSIWCLECQRAAEVEAALRAAEREAEARAWEEAAEIAKAYQHSVEPGDRHELVARYSNKTAQLIALALHQRAAALREEQA